MAIKVILLGHKARSGKDLLAEHLPIYTRLAFADKLKDVVQDLYGFTHEQMYGAEKDIMDRRYPNTRDPEKVWKGFEEGRHEPNLEYRPYLTPRRILQLFGQDQRSLCPDIWPNYVVKKMTDYVEINFTEGASSGRFVIPDFRFPNEYDVVKKWCVDVGADLLAIRIDRENRGVDSQDISETALNQFGQWDIIFKNNGTIEDFLGVALRVLHNQGFL